MLICLSHNDILIIQSENQPVNPKWVVVCDKKTKDKQAFKFRKH